MNFVYIDFQVKGRVAWVFLNRPEQRNALNTGALLELIEAFRLVDTTDDIGAAVLSGHGPVFVGGADLKEISRMNAMDYLEFGGHFNTLNRSIRENSKPVVGMINGHALGGGCILSMSPDIVIVSDKAKFGLPEINLGIFGGGFIMPRLVGRYRAAEIVLLGETYTAQEALEMGLVNRVVSREALLTTVEEYTAKLCSKSPLALKMAKKALAAGNLYNINTASEIQLPLMSMLFGGQDQKEGMQAFLEKRSPCYTGKW